MASAHREVEHQLEAAEVAVDLSLRLGAVGYAWVQGGWTEQSTSAGVGRGVDAGLGAPVWGLELEVGEVLHDLGGLHGVASGWIGGDRPGAD